VKVLVIGGTRFVGYQLAWRLIAAGHEVTLLNRGTSPDPFGGRVQRIRADRTTPAFGAALRDLRFDATVDFAAYVRADAEGLVAALGVRAGHIVFISSGQVYLVRDQVPRREAGSVEADADGPVMARPEGAMDQEEWDYGIGKREVEAALVHSGLPATRLRIPMVNGERDHYRRAEAYLYRLLDGGPVLLPDGGTARTRHVYGLDVARAIVDLLGKPEAIGQAFNLAQRETPTVRELVEHLRQRLGARSEIVAVATNVIEQRGLDVRALSPFSTRWMSFIDPGHAERTLGLAHTPLPRYLDAMVASFLAHPPATPPPGYAQRERECAAV
jgi:nucleoside-diphosphate-sugar epimerase